MTSYGCLSTLLFLICLNDIVLGFISRPISLSPAVLTQISPSMTLSSTGQHGPMAEVALTILYNKIENETRKALEERNQELLAIWNAEIIRLTPVPPIQPTGKYFSLFAAIGIVSIFHSLYLS